MWEEINSGFVAMASAGKTFSGNTRAIKIGLFLTKAIFLLKILLLNSPKLVSLFKALVKLLF